MSKSNTLWCLPYDTETYYKQFLKISFSKFLKQLVSNKYFPLYEKQMAKQLNDKYQWNDKCWTLLNFFEYLNVSFQISQLDIIVNFIEEEVLRRVMGHFRLWIDLQRLYLFNFLKLDRMEFMEDRIYMSLYRTMLFFHTLFSQYDYEDFHPQFIKNFCSHSVKLIETLMQFLSRSTKPLAQGINQILTQFSKKSAVLIKPQTLQIFKRQVKIRIVQQAQTIFDIQERLHHSVKYQQKLNQQNKMKMILEMSFIDGLTKQIQLLVDPKRKIIEQYQSLIMQNNLKQDPKQLQNRLKMHDLQINKDKAKFTLYQRLQLTSHDPYDQSNYKVYGSLINVDLDKKKQLQAKQQKEIISKNQDDQLKTYYQQDYIENVNKQQINNSKVTRSDLAKRTNTKGGSSSVKRSNDDQNKIYNLRYTFKQNSNRSPRPAGSAPSQREFDNNILFRNQIDDYLQNAKIQTLKRFAFNKCQTKTFMQIKSKLNKIFPEDCKISYGRDISYNSQPIYFSVNKLKTLNRNKFDEMRKIINYMAAQKKIKHLIMEKNIPDMYPRNYSDIKTLSYNPILFQQKINYANGKIIDRPQID